MKTTVIKCYGKKNGSDCWFIWRCNGTYSSSNPEYEYELMQIQWDTPAIGGTYYLNPKDPLTAVAVANKFFDEFTRMQCNGERPRLPCSPGVTY